ncbi:hypothetical protein ACTFIW_006690 [Dictyostelium discoideum]
MKIKKSTNDSTSNTCTDIKNNIIIENKINEENIENNNINNNNNNSVNNNNNNNNNNNDNNNNNNNNNNSINNNNNNNNNKNKNKNNNSYIPMIQYSNIHCIDWSSLISVDKLDLGSSNIFLIATFLNNKCEYNQVLLKSSTTIVQEVYASVLESILKLPIPEMRLLEYSNDEYIQMSRSLLTISSKTNKSLYDYIKLELLKSFFLIMEYAPNGKSFKDLDYKEYFSGYGGEKKLNQLGQVIAFDIFCNNSDRLPLIWDNVSSHFSNILFYDIPNRNGWYISLMNSNVTCINNSSFTIGYRKYITRVKSILYALFKRPNIESNQIKKMRESISKSYKINLSSSCGISIQRGIIQGVQLIISRISISILSDTKEKLRHLVKVDSTTNAWKKGLDSIHLPFLSDLLDTMVLFY